MDAQIISESYQRGGADASSWKAAFHDVCSQRTSGIWYKAHKDLQRSLIILTMLFLSPQITSSKLRSGKMPPSCPKHPPSHALLVAQDRGAAGAGTTGSGDSSIRWSNEQPTRQSANLPIKTSLCFLSAVSVLLQERQRSAARVLSTGSKNSSEQRD